MQGPEFRVQGPGSRVQGSGFRVQGPGSRVQGSGFGVQGYRELLVVCGIVRLAQEDLMRVPSGSTSTAIEKITTNISTGVSHYLYWSHLV